MSGTENTGQLPELAPRARQRPPRRRVAPPFWLRPFRFGGQMPKPATFWLIGFMAIFIIRPWEKLVPYLDVLRLETIGVIVVFARILLGRDAPLRLDRGVLPMLFFVACLVVVSLTSWDFELSYVPLETEVKVLIFGLCVYAAMRSPADLRAFCLGWVGISAVYMGKALYEYGVHGHGEWRMGFWRLTGIEASYGNPNAFSARMVVLIPIVVLLYQTTRNKRQRQLLLVCSAMMGATIVLTGSRAALLSALFAGFLYLMFSKRRMVAIAAIAVAGMISIVLLPDAIKERYETLLDPDANESATTSAEGRMAGFKKGVHLWLERPLVGIGPGVFPTSSEHTEQLPYEVVGLQPHNLVGQMLGETGLVGTLGFLVLVFATYAGALRMKRGPPEGTEEAFFMRRLGAAIGYATTLLLFLGLPSHNLYNYQWIWLSALAAAGASIRLPRTKRQSPMHPRAASAAAGELETAGPAPGDSREGPVFAGAQRGPAASVPDQIRPPGGQLRRGRQQAARKKPRRAGLPRNGNRGGPRSRH